MAGDRMGTGIIGRERQRGIAKQLEHHQQIAGRAVEVCNPHTVRVRGPTDLKCFSLLRWLVHTTSTKSARNMDK